MNIYKIEELTYASAKINTRNGSHGLLVNQSMLYDWSTFGSLDGRFDIYTIDGHRVIINDKYRCHGRLFLEQGFYIVKANHHTGRGAFKKIE